MEAISEYLTGKGLDVGADKVYDLAKKAAEEGHGAIGGFYLWTRIRYEECEKGFLCNKWKKKKTNWTRFAKRTSNNNHQFIYEVKLHGYIDAGAACAAALEDFNK